MLLSHKPVWHICDTFDSDTGVYGVNGDIGLYLNAFSICYDDRNRITRAMTPLKYSRIVRPNEFQQRKTDEITEVKTLFVLLGSNRVPVNVSVCF